MHFVYRALYVDKMLQIAIMIISCCREDTFA